VGGATVKEFVIETDADVTAGMEVLAKMCPRMQAAYVETGPLPLRRKPDGFAQLLNAIVGQQVSIASAAAIWGKLENAGMVTVEACSKASEDDLRELGLSRQKIRYTQELARADWAPWRSVAARLLWAYYAELKSREGIR